MSNWPKEDKLSFNRSEVMQEFEKRIIEAANILNQEISKIAQESVDDKIKKVQELGNAVRQTAKDMKDSGLAADDGALENNLEEAIQTGSQSEMIEESDIENLEESNEAKMAMLEEMQDLVNKAVSEGNYKVAYQIERTISEILDGE